MKFKVVIVLITFFLVRDIHACTCDGSSTVKDSFIGTSVVVHGKVMSMKRVSFANTIRADKVDVVRNSLKSDEQKLKLFEADFVYEVTLKVIDRFKGKIGTTLTIFTTVNSASCGFDFQVEKEYIIYASRRSYSYFFFLTESLKRII